MPSTQDHMTPKADSFRGWHIRWVQLFLVEKSTYNHLQVESDRQRVDWIGKQGVGNITEDDWNSVEQQTMSLVMMSTQIQDLFSSFHFTEVCDMGCTAQRNTGHTLNLPLWKTHPTLGVCMFPWFQKGNLRVMDVRSEVLGESDREIWSLCSTGLKIRVELEVSHMECNMYF